VYIGLSTVLAELPPGAAMHREAVDGGTGYPVTPGGAEPGPHAV